MTPLWRRLLGFNLLTAAVLAAVGWYAGWIIGHQVHAASLDYFSDIDQNDVALFMAYGLALVGFLVGLGFANYPLSRMLGRPPTPHVEAQSGLGRYFRLTTDHKVVGLQYLVGVGLFFAIAGLNAMLIRVELLKPMPTAFPAGQYISLVGLHGTMMIGMMSSVIIGPFGNYFVPLMIGARRVAFPRTEALTFWLLMAGGLILTSTVFFGGFPTGWTGYAPLSDEATLGMDSYICFFIIVAISITLLGLNLAITIITQRAPGMTWSRLPIFCWGVLATSALMVLAGPTLIATLLMVMFDRTVQTGFFLAAVGGSAHLYENLFWFFGHPEVYILAVPGFAVVLELVPVFARKPLWGYRLAVVGIVGVAVLSFFVWQHHLFVSGYDSNLRTFFMFSTEIISIPTGFVFLCLMGTLWRARMRLAVPMLFCLAWAFNFLVGGVSGVFLSDVPDDITDHGSFYVLAHLHYAIMGGLVFAFFAAIYFWTPKMTGYRFDERLSRIHFWGMFIFFNLTFMPFFVVGAEGQVRRAGSYAPNLQALNDFSSVSAFLLGASMLVFIVNVIKSLAFDRVPAQDNPWESLSLEWTLPTPVPVHGFASIPVIDSDPYAYGAPAPQLGATPATAPATGG